MSMGLYRVEGRVATLSDGVAYATHAERGSILDDLIVLADQYGCPVELHGSDGALIDTIEPAFRKAGESWQRMRDWAVNNLRKEGEK